MSKLLKENSNMNDLKKGDVIVAVNSNGARELVVERLGDLVWTRDIFDSYAVGPINDVQDLQDLINYGFDIEVSDE